MKKILSFFKNDIVKLVIGAVFFVAAICTHRYNVMSLCFYIISLLFSGIDVYISALKGIIRGDFFDEKFLMSIASIGAMIIGEYSEGVAVMLFFLVGEIFEHKAISESRAKIRALMDICPGEATVIRNGSEIVVDADEITVDDVIVIRAGERLAADAVVLNGHADIDTSALTGESIPRAVCAGSEMESGTIIINGLLHCKVLREASESGAQRILNMVENASENKSKEENFITAFSKVYTPIVVSLALILAILPPLFNFMSFNESVHRALIFLVISCPCALVISVPMAFFGGIGAAASRGILFKGGNSFSAVLATKTIAFDKTGTLTTGKFTVKDVILNKIEKNEILKLAASIEYGSNHPIAICLRDSIENIYKTDEVQEFAGKGAAGYINDDRIAVGNRVLMSDEGVEIPTKLEASDESIVLCAKNGDFIGAIIIGDTVKPEAKETIGKLKNMGIKRALILSGDNKKRAEAIAEMVGITEVKAELLPEDKYRELQKIIAENNGKTMYVGDGINDSPALAISDCGVAMGGIGSDSAIESADLVLMSDNLLRLPEAIKISQKTLRIAKQNIVFALAFKIGIMIFAAFGFANMWIAVFADVGVAILAILNSMRTLIPGKREDL